MMFHGKEINQDSIEYEMQDASDMIFQLLGAKYIDGTDLNDQELESQERLLKEHKNQKLLFFLGKVLQKLQSHGNI